MNNDTIYPSFNLYLQSDQADTVYGDANVIFELNEKITVPIGVNCLISLIDFEMPYSFYNITSVNNKFNVSTADGLLELEIEPQNYDTDTLTTYLNSKFSLFENNLGTLIVATFNYYTNKFSFTSDTLEFSILDTTTIDFEMGLTLPLNSNALSATAPKCVNLAGSPYIEIQSNLAITQVASHVDKTGVIARLPVRVEPSEYIFSLTNENIYHQIFDRNIDKIQITLKDYKGNILDLNGSIFSITLNFIFQNIKTTPSINPYKLNEVMKDLFNSKKIEKKEE